MQNIQNIPHQINQLTEEWKLLDEKLHTFERELILATEVDRKFQIQHAIKEIRTKRQQVEQQLRDLEAQSISEVLPENQKLVGEQFLQTQQKKMSLHNLATPPTIIGRSNEVAKVCEGLSSNLSIVTIQGSGGVGKSTLALAVGYLCCPGQDSKFIEQQLYVSENQEIKDRTLKASKIFSWFFPFYKASYKNKKLPPHIIFEKVIWIDLRHQKPSIEYILETILLTLGRSDMLRLNITQQQMEVVKLFQSIKCLLIADNLDVEEESITDFFMKVPTPSKILITTRRKFLFNTWIVSLEGLQFDEDIAKLIETESLRLGFKETISLSPEHIKMVKAHTGGAPLGIKWILAHIKQRGYSFNMAIEKIVNGSADSLYENLFSNVWSSIPDQCKNILFTMATFPSPCSAEELTSVSSISRVDTITSIDLLIDLSLVESWHAPISTYNRYSLHPLTRHYIRAREEYKKQEDFLLNDIIKFFLNFLTKYGGHKNWQGFEDIQNEIENIRGILDKSIAQSNWNVLISIVKQISYFWAIRGFWLDYEYYVQKCIDATHILGNQGDEAYFIMLISWLFRKRHKLDVAIPLLERAKELFTNINQPSGIAWSTRELAAIFETQERYEEALNYYSRSLELWKQVDSQDQVSHLLKDLGDLHRKIGNFELAKDYIIQTLEIEKKRGDSVAIANRTSKLGQIAYELGDYTLAERLIEEGMVIHLKMQNYVSQSLDLWYLAQIEEKRGNISKALDLSHEAYDIHIRLDLRDERRLLELIAQTIQRLSQTQKVQGQAFWGTLYYFIRKILTWKSKPNSK